MVSALQELTIKLGDQKRVLGKWQSGDQLMFTGKAGLRRCLARLSLGQAIYCSSFTKSRFRRLRVFSKWQ